MRPVFKDDDNLLLTSRQYLFKSSKKTSIDFFKTM